MAHLLGHHGCMESLRADLRDLQAAIGDVSAQAGAVRFPSWKFPHQVSCEPDVAALLDQYCYAEKDPKFTQHSHVVLLELVIDRLLLLLQSFTGYAENLLGKQAVSRAKAVGPCMSAGLTARRYWRSMLKMGAIYQQLLAETKTGRKNPTLRSASPARKAKVKCQKRRLSDGLKLRAPAEVARSTPLCPPSSIRAPGSDASASSLPQAACSTAESTHSIPTTTGSPLGACDACTSAQASLREVGRTITTICQSQSIPSALRRFQEVVEESTGRRTLSAKDMSYWASEQSKDLSRIGKHLQVLLQQVSPLRAELEESAKQKDELRQQVEDFSQLLRVEKETQAQQRKKAKQDLEAKDREYSEAVARLERDKDELRQGATLLEKRFCALKKELAAKAAVQKLGMTKTTLLGELNATKTVARSRVLELEKVQLLSGQRESLGRELSTTTSQLEKEKAKVESVLSHQESLQAKQRALLHHLSLDQEREELQASVGEAEEDKARLAQQLEESREQSGQQLRAQQELKLKLEQSVSELQATVSRLEEQEQELKKRERLLVLFPELHDAAVTQPESTESLTEMEQQIRANSIQISVLEQNMRHRAALAELKAAAEQGVLKPLGTGAAVKPVPGASPSGSTPLGFDQCRGCGLIPQTQLCSRLGSQRGREAGGQGTVRPSSRDSTGTTGCTAEARQRVACSQRSKPLPAEPSCKARPCPRLTAEGRALCPSPAPGQEQRQSIPLPLAPHRWPSQITICETNKALDERPPALLQGASLPVPVHGAGRRTLGGRVLQRLCHGSAAGRPLAVAPSCWPQDRVTQQPSSHGRSPTAEAGLGLGLAFPGWQDRAARRRAALDRGKRSLSVCGCPRAGSGVLELDRPRLSCCRGPRHSSRRAQLAPGTGGSHEATGTWPRCFQEEGGAGLGREEPEPPSARRHSRSHTLLPAAGPSPDITTNLRVHPKDDPAPLPALSRSDAPARPPAGKDQGPVPVPIPIWSLPAWGQEGCSLAALSACPV
ncbi:LOW QUALITY PROTEIN: coiled-coil domain-containing protein 157-like [Rhynochetos jubatus]